MSADRAPRPESNLPRRQDDNRPQHSRPPGKPASPHHPIGGGARPQGNGGGNGGGARGHRKGPRPGGPGAGGRKPAFQRSR